jgi:hypothetical protein
LSGNRDPGSDRDATVRGIHDFRIPDHGFQISAVHNPEIAFTKYVICPAARRVVTQFCRAICTTRRWSFGLGIAAGQSWKLEAGN